MYEYDNNFNITDIRLRKLDVVEVDVYWTNEDDNASDTNIFKVKHRTKYAQRNFKHPNNVYEGYVVGERKNEGQLQSRRAACCPNIRTVSTVNAQGYCAKSDRSLKNLRYVLYSTYYECFRSFTLISHRQAGHRLTPDIPARQGFNGGSANVRQLHTNTQPETNELLTQLRNQLFLVMYKIT